MKNFSLALLLASTCLFVGFSANAMYQGPGSAENSKSTVAQVKEMPDESMVLMEGTITSQEGSETYIFTDSTGTINLEIEADDWNGQKINAEDIVLIQGEVDKDGNLVEVDVEEITLVNPQ